MADILETQREIVQEFLEMEDWNERYERIVDLGKELKPLAPEFHLPEWKVSGCVSQVWLKPKLENGLLFFDADSDSIFVKGLIALLVKAYSGFSAEDILQTDPEFIREIGISDNLSPNRANGLGSMVKKIKDYAKAYTN